MKHSWSLLVVLLLVGMAMILGCEDDETDPIVDDDDDTTDGDTDDDDDDTSDGDTDDDDDDASDGDTDDDDDDATDGDTDDDDDDDTSDGDTDDDDDDTSDGDEDGDTSDGDVDGDTDGDETCSECSVFTGDYCLAESEGQACAILGTVDRVWVEEDTGVDCGFVVHVTFNDDTPDQSAHVVGCNFDNEPVNQYCNLSASTQSGDVSVSCPGLCDFRFSQSACEPVPQCTTAQDCFTETWDVRCVGHWSCNDGICAETCDDTGCGDGTCDAQGGENLGSCSLDCANPRDTHCDDGSTPSCNMIPPACDESSILAYQNDCYRCVNPVSCVPWGDAGCRNNEDCKVDETCDDCATSSCPTCEDCVAACMPVTPQCTVAQDCLTETWNVRCLGHWACNEGSCEETCEETTCGDSSCDAAGGENEQSCSTDCTEVRDTHCDDGSTPMCDLIPPVCDDYSLFAYQNDCYRCVNPVTCLPWGEAACTVAEGCPEPRICNDCATSSCPACDDCVAACVASDD